MHIHNGKKIATAARAINCGSFKDTSEAAANFFFSQESCPKQISRIFLLFSYSSTNPYQKQ